jgi:spore maturation protein CgeB
MMPPDSLKGGIHSACLQAMDPFRILLVDTTLHSAPWPLFLEALDEQASPAEFLFFDEAQYLLPRALKTRILTRVLDHLTLTMRDPANRRRATELAGRIFRYRRHPVNHEAFNAALVATAQSFRPQIIVVVMGFHIAAKTLKTLKSLTAPVIVNYATDDPFNFRLSNSDVTASIPLYDVYACTKRAIMKDVSRAGCRGVHYVPFGYKPSLHFPERPGTPEEISRFDSDVAFIGEADADRMPFFQRLLEAMPDVNLALYGGMWDRHPATRRYARGVVRGRDFRLALGGTKIAVNLVRRGNRDDHVMRTFEAPACGAFLLNERTPEHLTLLAEGEAAGYFSSETDFADKTRHFLHNEQERDRIRRTGYEVITGGRNTYTDRLRQIMELCKFRNAHHPMQSQTLVNISTHAVSGASNRM